MAVYPQIIQMKKLYLSGKEESRKDKMSKGKLENIIFYSIYLMIVLFDLTVIIGLWSMLGGF